MYDIGLYPPIFNQSYASAFLATASSSCKIYFQIPSLNSIEEIKHETGTGGVINFTALQITVRQQKTNRNVLTSRYRNGILIARSNKDENGYYIQIANSSINGGFQPETYYKIQMRFTAENAQTPPSENDTSFSTWLTNNVEYFSQWSSVILVKAISQPSVNNLSINNSLDNTVSLSTNVIKIAGQVDFIGKEKIEQFNIVLVRNGVIAEDSGDIYLPANNFQYIVKNMLSNGTYYLTITFTTTNLYKWSVYRTIQITNATPVEANIMLETQLNEDAGYVKLIIKRNTNYSGSSTTLFAKNYRIIIRRCSSRDNFYEWSILADHIITKNSISSLQFYDCTMEPGIWYHYQVIRYDNSDIMTALLTSVLETSSNNSFMLDTNEIFLNAGGKGLTIKFNPSITNLTNKVVQSITETLGSKYPFIRRNGNVNYKTFSLSGIISYFMDVESNILKASKDNVYGSSESLYKDYTQQNNINVYNDYFYEKFFREKVIDFLESNKVKLFRSLSQGNILIKLSNVTLTPNQTLNRMIYEFNCTAYEVAECNAQNYRKYNILQDIEQI